MLQGQALHFIVVDCLRVPVHAVRDELVQVAGEVDRSAVGQVAPLVQLHPHYRIPGFQQSEVHRHVGLGSAVGLDVGVLRAEEFLGPLDCQGFHNVHVFAATVVAAARVAFGVLVVHHPGLGLENSLAGVIFGSDEDYTVPLPRVLLLNCPGNFGVLFHE